MRWPTQLKLRMQMLVGRRNARARLDDELHFHLEQQIAENIAAGMSASEARYAALRTFGNPALLREQSRATWSWNTLEQIWNDVRYGIRTLRRTPGFAAIAIVVMALGIGANVALFTVVRSVILKPLPYRDPNQLVTIYEADFGGNHPQWSPWLPVDGGSMKEWQQAAQGMARMAFLSPWQGYNLSAEGGRLPETISAAWCSWNFFDTLGVQAALGRTFSAADDRPGAPPSVVLTHSFWKRRYSGDPAIVGKTIWLDARPYAVIGVLPESFVYLSKMVSDPLQVWTPLTREAPPALLNVYEDHEFLVTARLMPGVTLQSLVERLRAVQKHIVTAHPQPAVHNSVSAMSMLDDAVYDYKTPLFVLLAATCCVLLIASMNVASLLMARTAARARELAIRTALGGGRLRLIRERLIESLLLSVCGGALGLLLAWASLQWLMHARHDMHRVESIHMDGVVIAFAVGAIVLCTLFAGLISAFSSAGKQILATLQESSRAQSAGRARAGMRRALLVMEVGLTVVLLVGAGLLLKSYQHLRNADLGVPVDNVLTMHISLPEARYKKPEQWVAFFEDLIGRVRALPGVQSAGLVSKAPGEGWGGDHLMRVLEHPAEKGHGTDMMVRGADPGYFEAIGIPLLRGRIFNTSERLERAHVAVISQAAARAFFGSEDPIGKHLTSDFNGEVVEVVGVVGDTRWIASEPPQPTLFWPIYGNDYSVATIVVRSERDVASFALPVEKIVGQLDPDLPFSDVMTLREAIGKSAIDSQFDSILVMAFAAIALVLAAAGLYGVLAYLVTQRTSEIGIRLALGSPRRQVLRLMLLDGVQPALLGLAGGLAASAAVVRLIRSMLYETRPLDPVVFAAVSATLLAVAALACLVPAWRASRVNPMQALRTE
ncbi:MAG TPA: ABC transporter permease [Terracidiphilus sp.]|jgi:putative ABC transport system permease protein